MLVSQRESRVDVYRREGRRWVLEQFTTGKRLSLESLDVELAVDDAYVDGIGAIVG